MKAFEMVDGEICPAYAGMILLRVSSQYSFDYLSRVCGDDPKILAELHEEFIFVPRMRG